MALDRAVTLGRLLVSSSGCETPRGVCVFSLFDLLECFFFLSFLLFFTVVVVEWCLVAACCEDDEEDWRDFNGEDCLPLDPLAPTKIGDLTMFPDPTP